jgi:hypothetical protein
MFDPSDKAFDIQRSLEPFPQGRHLVFVSDVKPFVSQKGSEAVEFEFTCHDPRSKARGRRLKWQRFWLSEKSLWRLARLCRSCVTMPAAFDPRDSKALDDALLDQILVISVKHQSETYQGKARLREDIDTTERPSADDLEALREAYGSTMLPPADEPADEPADNHDEIPF